MRASEDSTGARSLRRRLEDATAPIHRRVEAALPLLDAELSCERYRHVLEVLYGFYLPMEAGLATFATAAPIGLELRDRAALLRHDLVAVGRTPCEVDALPCAAVPRPSRLAHAAGSLYVIEGASLGGQVVARAVRRHLGLEKANGAAFFVGDGDGTAGRWVNVLGWLDASVGGGARTDEIVAAACATFEALSRWIARCQRG